MLCNFVIGSFDLHPNDDDHVENVENVNNVDNVNNVTMLSRDVKWLKRFGLCSKLVVSVSN